MKAGDQLLLPFERRQKSRLRAALASGEEVALELPRGEVLRGGDWLVASDGRAIEVVAAPERVLHVECASPQALARAAYHLGNRHVPVQVGDGWLRIADDHVLAHMLEGLGAKLTSMDAAVRARGRRLRRGPSPPRPRIDPRRPDSRVPPRSNSQGRRMNLRLLQLASPALPVGAYSYSQGLEAAVEARHRHRCRERPALDRRRARACRSPRMEAPVLLRLDRRVAARATSKRCARWNAEFIASRETAELRAETLQMGYSLSTTC